MLAATNFLEKLLCCDFMFNSFIRRFNVIKNYLNSGKNNTHHSRRASTKRFKMMVGVLVLSLLIIVIFLVQQFVILHHHSRASHLLSSSSSASFGQLLLRGEEIRPTNSNSKSSLSKNRVSLRRLSTTGIVSLMPSEKNIQTFLGVIREQNLAQQQHVAALVVPVAALASVVHENRFAFVLFVHEPEQLFEAIMLLYTLSRSEFVCHRHSDDDDRKDGDQE